jgi:hypothetical protein
MRLWKGRIQKYQHRAIKSTHGHVFVYAYTTTITCPGNNEAREDKEDAMPLEIVHVRKSDTILREKGMEADVADTLAYIEQSLYGTMNRGELLREVLEEMGWRGNGESLTILEKRRYRYKGVKNEVAIEGNFSAYEFILEGLFRLQVGFDKGMIEAGILLLTSQRSENTPYGNTLKLVTEEIDMLYPTISLPVSVALFDLGGPITPDEKGGG